MEFEEVARGIAKQAIKLLKERNTSFEEACWLMVNRHKITYGHASEVIQEAEKLAETQLER